MATLLKVLSIAGSLTIDTMRSMGFPSELLNEGLRLGYISVANNEASLTNVGKDYVDKLPNVCDVSAFKRLYNFYASRPRSLERDIALVEYGSSYLEYINYGNKEAVNDVLSTCLRLARFGFEANALGSARRYGIKASLMRMKTERYDATLEGFRYAVSKVSNALTIYPYLDTVMKLDPGIIAKYPREYSSLMLSIEETFLNNCLCLRNHWLRIIRHSYHQPYTIT